MKVSYAWLKTYFDKPIPKPDEIARLFTMHAFELEGIETAGGDTIFDFKILPNRAHDCLGHDGVARELSVLSGIPLKKVSIKGVKAETTEHELKITVEGQKLCRRYAGRIIENVSVGESPAWLKERLEAIGQRSINNVVDITNYVMFTTGQPMHAFDLDKLAKDGNTVEIIVRTAKKGEKLMTLDAKDLALDETMLVIADKEKPVALAGVKGGKWAEVDSGTKNIILESANFEPTSTRKTSVKVGIRTDSEKRFENGIAPEIAGAAMDMASALAVELSGGRAGEIADIYPRKRNIYKIGVSAPEVNKLLGTELSESEVEKIIKRLGFEYEIIDNPIEKILTDGEKFLGVPYTYGASISYDAPKTFDCSSFVGYLFAQNGVQIPRMAVDQFVFGEEIGESDLKPGDLIFSNTKEGKVFEESVEFLPGTKVPAGIDHVGIYAGGGKVLHASRHPGKVVIEPLSESVKFKNISGYRRIPVVPGKKFVVSAPPERLDLIATRSFYVSGNTEDLIEEIGRVHGYEDIKSIAPMAAKTKTDINKTLHYANVFRKTLQSIGFSEVQTYALVENGEVELENPMAEDKKFLRTELSPGIQKSLELNAKNAPLIGVSQVKIFEIGKVFSKDGEHTSCALAVSEQKKNPADAAIAAAKAKLEEVLGAETGGKIKNGVFEFDFDAFAAKLPEPAAYEIPEVSGALFKPVSPYPFALRDVAVFVPSGTGESAVKNIIENEAGDLLVRTDLFDRFEKDGKISYAFHLVFQSHEKTLSDDELNELMNKVTGALNNHSNWQVR